MTAVQPSGLVDTRSMVCLHTFLRREFRLAAGAVRAVGAAEIDRVSIIAEHLEWLCGMLHHHHVGEDRLLWPKLLARVPQELAPIVSLMQAQHARVDELLGDIERVRPQWRARGEAADRDELAGLFDELYVVLCEHLDAEEERMLPIVARTITHAEWNQLHTENIKDLRKADLPLLLGMIQYEGDPEVVAEMVSHAPRLIRLIVPPLARRAFRKHAMAVHGTATP